MIPTTKTRRTLRMLGLYQPAFVPNVAFTIEAISCGRASIPAATFIDSDAFIPPDYGPIDFDTVQVSETITVPWWMSEEFIRRALVGGDI